MVCTVLVVGLALAVLMYWLGARGQFLLLDNIVRNRGAIAEPWRRYARQANRVFFFHLICLGASLAVLLVLDVPAVLIGLPAVTHHAWPRGLALVALLGLGVAYLIFALLFFCVVFLFREWGAALIFRRDLTLGQAVGETWGIVRRWPGPTFLFLLLRVALGLGSIVIALLSAA